MKDWHEGKWNAWLETHELAWMNWNKWADMSDLKWVTWHDWLEMKKLKQWMTWMNLDEWIDMNELKRMSWNKWIEINDLSTSSSKSPEKACHVFDFDVINLMTMGATDEMELWLQSRAHFVDLIVDLIFKKWS